MVSAVALRKFRGVFHLVIVERELKPYATLNVTNPTWHMYSTVEYFHIHDANVREGIDYHTLVNINILLLLFFSVIVIIQ